LATETEAAARLSVTTPLVLGSESLSTVVAGVAAPGPAGWSKLTGPLKLTGPVTSRAATVDFPVTSSVPASFTGPEASTSASVDLPLTVAVVASRSPSTTVLPANWPARPLVDSPRTPTPSVERPTTPLLGPRPYTPVPGTDSCGTTLPAKPKTPMPSVAFAVPRTPMPPDAASHEPAVPAQPPLVYPVRPRMPSGRLIPTG
jgi:hypothetical protein